MAMAMEAFDAFRQNLRQLLRKYTEPASWGAGVVEFGLYLTVFRVDTKPVRHKMLGEMGHFWQHPLILRKGIEGDVAAAMQYLVELFILVCRAIGMRKGAELLQRKPRLAKAACCSMTDEMAENWKCAPQRECLESKDYLHVGFVGHTFDELQVAAKQRLLNKIIRAHFI